MLFPWNTDCFARGHPREDVVSQRIVELPADDDPLLEFPPEPVGADTFTVEARSEFEVPDFAIPFSEEEPSADDSEAVRRVLRARHARGPGRATLEWVGRHLSAGRTRVLQSVAAILLGLRAGIRGCVAAILWICLGTRAVVRAVFRAFGAGIR